MADLSTLKTSITDLPKEDQLDLVENRRQSRLTQKEKVKKQVPIYRLARELSQEQAQEALELIRKYQQENGQD